MNSFSLTGLSNVSTTGFTSLRLHVDGGQPSGDNYVQFAAFEDSNTPAAQLVLTWSTGPAVAPSNSGLPVVSGSAQVGQTLSASTGSWSGTAPISYAYQWQRCGSSCANVGSNQATYVLSSADVGSRMQVVVTASNGAGSGSATSAQTAVVAAQANSGTLTVPLASAGDDGDVDLSGAQSAGYPPSGTAAVNAAGKTVTAGRRLAFNSYGVYVPLLRFDTSGLPAGATVTGATLKLFVNKWVNADGRNLVAEWAPSAVWPLASQDWTLNSTANALSGAAVSSPAVRARWRASR